MTTISSDYKTFDVFADNVLKLIYSKLTFHEKFNVMPLVSKCWQRTFVNYITHDIGLISEEKIFYSYHVWLNYLTKQVTTKSGFSYECHSFPLDIITNLFSIKAFKTFTHTYFELFYVVNTRLKFKTNVFSHQVNISSKDRVINFIVQEKIDEIVNSNLKIIGEADLDSIRKSVTGVRFYCNEAGVVLEKSTPFAHAFTFHVKHFQVEGQKFSYLDWNLDEPTEIHKGAAFKDFSRWTVISRTADVCAEKLKLSQF